MILIWLLLLFIFPSVNSAMDARGQPKIPFEPHAAGFQNFCRDALALVPRGKFGVPNTAFAILNKLRWFTLGTRKLNGLDISALEAMMKVRIDQLISLLDRGRLQAAEQLLIRGVTDVRAVWMKTEVSMIHILNTLLKLNYISDLLKGASPDLAAKLKHRAAKVWKDSERWRKDFGRLSYFQDDIRLLVQTRLRAARATEAACAAAAALEGKRMMCNRTNQPGYFDEALWYRVGIADQAARGTDFNKGTVEFLNELREDGVEEEALAKLHLIDWDKLGPKDRGPWNDKPTADAPPNDSDTPQPFLGRPLIKAARGITEIQQIFQWYELRAEAARTGVIFASRPWVLSLLNEGLRRVPLVGRSITDSPFAKALFKAYTDWRAAVGHFPELAMLYDDHGGWTLKLEKLMEISSGDPEILETLFRRLDLVELTTEIIKELNVQLAATKLAMGENSQYVAFKERLLEAMKAAKIIGPIRPDFQPSVGPMVFDAAVAATLFFAVHKYGWNAAWLGAFFFGGSLKLPGKSPTTPVIAGNANPATPPNAAPPDAPVTAPVEAAK